MKKKIAIALTFSGFFVSPVVGGELLTPDQAHVIIYNKCGYLSQQSVDTRDFDKSVLLREYYIKCVVKFAYSGVKSGIWSKDTGWWTARELGDDDISLQTEWFKIDKIDPLQDQSPLSWYGRRR